MKLFRNGTVVFFALTTLAGCGPAIRKSGLPRNGILSPVAIYIHPCALDNESADAKIGHIACIEASSLLSYRLAASGLRYEVMPAASWSGAGNDTFTPDIVREKSLGARYRFVLDKVYGYRVSSPTYPKQQFTASHLEIFANIHVVDLSDNNLAGSGLIRVAAGMEAGSDIANRIINGLNGPRCESINSWSISGDFRSSFGKKCASFSLDNNSDISKNPFRNIFGMGKSRDEK